MAWTTINRRKGKSDRGSVFDRIGPAITKEDEVNKISSSVFVTNFPASCGKSDLWEIGAKHDIIVDVYIPNRLSKSGNKFAFMRFIRVSDTDKLVTLLRGEWIGNFRLFACKPRFDRDMKISGTHPHAYVQTNHEQKLNPNIGESSFVNGKSYAKVARGEDEKHNASQKQVVMLESVSPIVNHMSGEKAVFAKVKHLHSIPTLYKLCGSEGFLDISLKYVGGLWVLVEFQTSNARNTFLKHKGMSNWVTKVIPWSRNFAPRERFIWLDIEGIPLVAWSIDSIRRIARVWGDIVFTDEEEEDNYSSARVCVESVRKDFVMEQLEVDVEGRRYNIRVKEVTCWRPSFKKERELEDDNKNLSYEKEDTHYGESEEEDVEEYVANTFGDNNDNKDDDAGLKNKEIDDVLQTHSVEGSTPTHPPGFGPYDTHKPLDGDTSSLAPDIVHTPPVTIQQMPVAALNNHVPVIVDSVANGDTSDVPKALKQHNIKDSFLKGIKEGKENKESISSSFRSNEKQMSGGFSIHQRLEEAIKLGKTLGINMEGCERDMEKLIAGTGEKIFK